MKRMFGTTLGLSLLVASLVSQAEGLSPTPEPGLWRTESTTLINGEDLQATIKAAQESFLESMPADQRDMMRQIMASQDEANAADMECISATEANAMANPEAVLAKAREDMPDCQLTLESSSSDKLVFTGTCSGDEGYDGDMRGELTMQGSREMHTRFVGQGRMDVGDLPVDGDGTVNIESSSVSRWVAADCGDVKPYSE